VACTHGKTSAQQKKKPGIKKESISTDMAKGGFHTVIEKNFTLCLGGKTGDSAPYGKKLRMDKR